MCYFITIGLPDDKAKFLEDHIPHGFHIAPIANSSVLQQMGRGLRTYLLMSGGCSCSLFSKPPSDPNDGHSKQDRRRYKYEKMGWSAAKIERALTQRAKDREVEEFDGLRGGVQRFLGDLATNVVQLAVLVHWYDGDVQEARFTCKQGEVVSPDRLLEERLRIVADEIIWIKR